MEQQTISVAKAGMVTKLRSRCAILASTNSKFGKYDVEQPLCLNTGLNSPLLSRFDLILVLTDTKSAGWDEQDSEYLLNKQGPQSGNEESEWSLDQLKAYLAFVRQILPGITEEAKEYEILVPVDMISFYIARLLQRNELLSHFTSLKLRIRIRAHGLGAVRRPRLAGDMPHSKF